MTLALQAPLFDGHPVRVATGWHPVELRGVRPSRGPRTRIRLFSGVAHAIYILYNKSTSKRLSVVEP